MENPSKQEASDEIKPELPIEEIKPELPIEEIKSNIKDS